MRKDKGQLMRRAMRLMYCLWTALLVVALTSCALAKHAPAPKSSSASAPSAVATTSPDEPSDSVASAEPTTTPAATTEAAVNPETSTKPASEPATTEATTATPAATEPVVAATEPAAATSEPAVAATKPATQPATREAAAAPYVPLQMNNPALAERLASIATVLLRSQNLNQGIWTYAEALLQASCRLAPDEPRFAQYLMEAATCAGDHDTAVAALAAYRKLRPDDEFAQTQQIDDYLAPLELAKKIDYMNQILETTEIPATVRSYAAQRAAQFYAERLDNLTASDMIDKAIELNPLNLQAMRIKYQAHPPADPADASR